MPDPDTLFLALVLSAFGVFMLTLAWTQWFTRERREPDRGTSVRRQKSGDGA